MITEWKIKKILLVLLSSNLVLYILITELFFLFLSLFSFDIGTMTKITFPIKLVSFVTSVSFIFLTSKSKIIAKFFLKDKYIGGKYKGFARKISQDNEIIDTHNEELIIVQNLLFMKVSGESCDNDNDTYAQWDGFAIFADKDIDRYDFIIRINYNRGVHTGILELTIRDRQIKGYHPARYGKWFMDLKKVK